jgi:tetratricopeptide (TPR) repeat protein
MNDYLREQIHKNFISKETEDLLEIWKKGDTSEWEQEVFEIIKEILFERLGYVPPQSIEIQVWQILDKIEEHIKNNELDKALSECEIAVQLDPNFAKIFEYRGDIYDEMGKRDKAIINYKRAIQLDPELVDAREIMLNIESEIKKEIETQVWQILVKVEEYLKNHELDKALSACETAIQLDPNYAITYDFRGTIYDEMGQRENALVNYQKAIHLDPALEDAWENMLSIEAEIKEEFEESIAKQHLDQALEFAYDDEPEKALEECEMAKLSMPNIAIAHNYLGLILQTLNQKEPAIDSYLEAIQLNPRFYAARENLGNIRVAWEEEQYRLFSNLSPIETQETNIEFDESQIPDSEEHLPQWLYMDEKAFLLAGWAGHRTRLGHCGYDPLESDFEYAHMQGVIIRLLLNRKFRTRNPIYLIFMAFIGLLYCLYGLAPFLLGNFIGIITGLISVPYSVVGILLLTNVYLSLQFVKPDEFEDWGEPFF